MDSKLKNKKMLGCKSLTKTDKRFFSQTFSIDSFFQDQKRLLF